jgi:hypothetical protein
MTEVQSVDNERARCRFEELPWYPKPPLILFPEFDYLISTEHSAIQYKNLPQWLIRAFWTSAGLKSFYRQFPQHVENFLREYEDSSPNGLLHAATLTLDNDPRDLGPIDRAAILLFALHDLYQDITSGNFAPDRHGDQVLEMGCYPNLFSTGFILENGRLRLFKSTNTSHITVIVRGKFYSVRVGKLGTETTIKQLRESLLGIAERAKQSGSNMLFDSPGLLTCANEGTQRRIFSKLNESEVNARSLLALRHSFVTLCLDLDSFPSSDAEAALTAHSRNIGNRWFHSSVQIVVFGSGRACMIAHSSAGLPGDVMMRAAHEIQTRALSLPEASEAPGAIACLLPVQEFEWEINQEFIMEARRDFEPFLDKQQASFEIMNVGKSYFSRHELPAVPIFILALQLAIKRLTGKIDVIRQFLSMSKYRCMGIGLAVVTTKEVIEFITYMENGDAQADRALSLMKNAIDSQLQVCRRARKYIPLDYVLGGLMRSIEKSNKWWPRIRVLMTMSIVRLFYKLGLIQILPNDVVVSHPRVYPDVSIVGRPGVRVPYVKDFALHYQIHDQKIVTTIMPSQNWAIPNVDLVASIQKSFEEIQTVINGAPGNGGAK